MVTQKSNPARNVDKEIQNPEPKLGTDIQNPARNTT